MPLKYKVEESKFTTDVPEAQRTLYVKRDGLMFLDVDGAVDSDVHSEFRNNNRDVFRLLGVATIADAKTKLEAIKDIDPVAYGDLKKKVKDYEDGKNPKIDELVTERTKVMVADHTKVLGQRDDTIKGQAAKLQKLMIDDALTVAATAKGVLPSAIEDVKLRGRTIFRLEGDDVIAVDTMGKPMYGKDSKPLSIPEWMERLATEATHLFGENKGGGSGGGQRHPSYDKANPYSKATHNMTEQARLERDNPTLAKQLQASAQR
jgi:hypothetical protein